jgi:hypothetical protein
MKIAIDLNDVVRDYTAQFASYYKRTVDRSFDIDNVDVWTNDLKEVFPFESKQKYLEFVYNDFAFELYGSAQPLGTNVISRFSDWMKDLEDLDEVPEVCIVSTGEYDKTIGSTYFFLSKLACKVREVHLFLKEDNIWDLCDVLITANPILLQLKPENKLSIKIDSAYNTEIEADYSFDQFTDFTIEENIIKELNNKLIK